MIAALLLAAPWASADEREGMAPAVTVHFFWAENCPHCAEGKVFLQGLKGRLPRLSVESYDVWKDRESFETLLALASRQGVTAISTPAIVVGPRVWFGFSPSIAAEIEAAAVGCLAGGCADALATTAAGAASAPPPPALPEGPTPVETPFGALDADRHSLPLFTILLGLLDSFNPCAFFVLLFLLSLMVHARSRKSMLLVGGTFVFFSGAIYYLFMAAWLNLFLLAGQLRAITAGAGAVALLVGALNVKDYFRFRQGASLSIPEEAKPRLFARMRGLLQATRTSTILAGTAVLAVAANSYELLCTAGFPMVYTRVLTLRDLPHWQYYAYLLLYNLVYVLPLFGIVLAFTLTMGSRKLTETEGRVLKLVSGLMMLCLGGVLLTRPEMLQRLGAAVAVLGVALALAAAMLLLFPPGGRRRP